MSTTIPNHLGFIVDGNRRWARERNLPTLEGHRRGLKKVEKIVELGTKAGVKYMTFFLFSTENWSRSKEEVDYLMDMAETQITKLAKKLHKNNIRFVVLGARERVSTKLLDKLDASEALTKDNTAATVSVCFNYGGRDELVHAVQAIVKDDISPSDITEQTITEHIYHPEIPDVDMVVRTSGEARISGFMLWRAAYSEFLFIKKNWPAISEKDFDKVLSEYSARSRRFGA